MAHIEHLFQKSRYCRKPRKKFFCHEIYFARQEELNKGWSIVIFPEGKIPIEAPKLDLFKNGPFKLAIDAQIPILPITIIDNWKLFYTDPVLTGLARPGFARVIIHDEISTKGMSKKDLVSLRHHTFEVINKPLLKYNKEVYQDKK